MKLKNVKVGQVVQIKNIHEEPTDSDARTCYQFGVNIEEHEGVIVSEPDYLGDVRVQFGEWFEHQAAPERNYLFVHHSKLRKVK